METIVIGHRNPDMDSICSALAYAELKRLSGQSGVRAARAGSINERIDFVLKKFGVEAPVLIKDMSPRVADVMETEVVAVRAGSSVYDALQIIERNQMRGLPVVDEMNRCLGLLSAFKITHHLYPSREQAESARHVTASLEAIMATFGGSLVAGVLSSEPAEQLLMVGAMAEDSFATRLERYGHLQVVLFVGDRPQILSMAIKARVNAIVCTGGYPIDEVICEEAREASVTMILSPHDTATSVLLARGAAQVERVLESEYQSFEADTFLEDARGLAAQSAGFIFPVLDSGGGLVGILSKSDFLKEIPRQIILVDHNELDQAVRGAEKIKILEVIDHHKLGGISSDTPILFLNNPLGSTCTIVSLCYEQMGIAISPSMAGLMMAGIIADTLNLTSPTNTPVDVAVLGRLGKIAAVDPDQLAREIFSVGSPLLTMTTEQAIRVDSKPYADLGYRFSVAQIEELNFDHFEGRRADLLEALELERARDGLLFACLLVTDISGQNSYLLVRGAERFLRTISYPLIGPEVWMLAGVVSRKKQLLPFLLQCLARMSSHDE